MELLIIKSGREYLRFKNNDDLLVQLDKASVFPMEKIDLVEQHETRLKAKGFGTVRIKKLILTEEDL